MTASEWWKFTFGECIQDALDYTGRQIKKAAYNQAGSKFGWVLEYILPLDKGGCKSTENIHIVSYEAFTRRDGKITYTIDGTRYQVQRNEQGNYSIYKIGDKRMDFWTKEFGNVKRATDFAGYEVDKSSYGDENSAYGWDIDHIQPLSKGGKDADENKQIVSIYVNREKSDKTTFIIDDIQYQVRKTKNAYESEWADYDYSDKKYCVVEME